MIAVGPGASGCKRSGRQRMIVPILIVVGCALLIPIGYQTLQSARASSHWPRIQSVIHRSAVEAVAQRGGNNLYFARVRDAYSVGGSEYTGGRICFGTEDAGTVDQGQAERLTERYPKTKMVDVYYNPA